MSRFTNALSYYRKHGLGETAKFSWIKARSQLANNELGWKFLFELNPFVATGSPSDYGNGADIVWQELQKISGLLTKELHVDPQGYRNYVTQAHYETFDPYYRGGDSGDDTHRAEKLLQHYLSMELLKVTPDDVYVDVASNTSPMKEIVRRLSGAKTYSLDLSYPPGIHGDQIGCDAGAMPLADGSVSKMTLHCSFEHFAGDADSRFVRECARVLRPGGAVCIVPLYILPRYCIRMDPTLECRLSVPGGEQAPVIFVKGYKVDFGRFYDPRMLHKRVLEHCHGLEAAVHRIRGLESIGEATLYSHFALTLLKKS